MRSLFLAVVALIAYGSLFPFEFHAEPAPFASLFEHGPLRRGDLLGNVALFVPFGYLAMVAWQRPGRAARWVLVLVAAAVYGAALQWAQLFLPARDPSLVDVAPNVAGAAAGALLGAVPALDARRLVAGGRVRLVPWLLIGCWLLYRLLPLVPALDWQEWKESVKPLLLHPRLTWTGILHDAAAWLAVGALWAAAPLGRVTARALPLVVVATLGLEVVIVSNTVSADNVAGAAAGLAAALLLTRAEWRAAAAAPAVTATIVAGGLAPFTMRGEPAPFLWTPFAGFLGGSMFVNTQSLIEKLFLYGALLWLAREAGLRLRHAGPAAALLLGAVELVQTRVGDHTPEITDPLLALALALFLAAADRPGASPPDADPHATR